MVEVLPHRALHSITKHLSEILKFLFDIFTDAMQTLFKHCYSTVYKCFECSYWQEPNPGYTKILSIFLSIERWEMDYRKELSFIEFCKHWMHGEFAFHWFLKMEIRKRAMIRFGYLRQSYFVYVPLVPPHSPKRPHGWDQWDVLVEVFKCK